MRSFPSIPSRVFPPVLLALALLALPSRAAPETTRAREGERLYQDALRHLARRSIEGRRTAIADLEQATLQSPGHAEYELALAHAYYDAGFLRLARTRFERVAGLSPEDPASRFGLGRVWRRDWLKYLDRTSLARSVENFSMAARFDPASADSWIELTPLLIEQGQVRAAAAAARQALDRAPNRPEAMLAAAQTAFRTGDVERAESLYVRAIPLLPPLARARFEDISPLATERDTVVLHHLPRARQAEFVRRFWVEHDPDPTTPENEVQLEYWSRVTQAYFLYFDAKRREWDERGEVYVRYGPPEVAEYNPIGAPNRVQFGQYGSFPANALVWDYPSLGMMVTMLDRILSEYYLLPISLEEDLDPRPDPDSLARHDDQLATRGGRGVFPMLPPGVHRVPVDAAIARFESGDHPRLLAQVETPGAPGDSLWAQWVVFDTSATAIASGRNELSPSPCAAGERRTADFDALLPPGRYRLGISVHGPGGGRGVFRDSVVLAPVAGDLALSDVVISCGAPDVSPGAIRLAPNPARRVKGEAPLTAYFEIYHLRTDAQGQSRFEYVYTVRSAEKDRRIWLQRLLQPRPQVPPISASREAENTGTLRRQFVSVPVRSLPAGRYRLEIRVRDLLSGDIAVRDVEFVHEVEVAAVSGAAVPPAPVHE